MKYILSTVFLPVILIGAICALVVRAFMAGYQTTNEHFEKKI